MSTPFMGELRWISFNFAPQGWALANGQTLPINQNQALFSLFGTMYGGNGQTTFQLPDVRSRVVVGVGQQFNTQGQRGGEEFHTVIQTEMPAHIHFANASSANADSALVAGTLLAAAANVYTGAANLTTLLPATVGNIGGSQPHENRQPYLVLNCIIALQGIFPSRN